MYLAFPALSTSFWRGASHLASLPVHQPERRAAFLGGQRRAVTLFPPPLWSFLSPAFALEEQCHWTQSPRAPPPSPAPRAARRCVICSPSVSRDRAVGLGSQRLTVPRLGASIPPKLCRGPRIRIFTFGKFSAAAFSSPFYTHPSVHLHTCQVFPDSTHFSLSKPLTVFQLGEIRFISNQVCGRFQI